MLPAVMAPYGILGAIGWFICGLGAIILSLMLANISKRLPKIGGPYAYAHAGFGDFIGFWVGWGYWISLWSATAAISIACVGYLAFFIPALTTDPVYKSNKHYIYPCMKLNITYSHRIFQ